MMEVGNGLNDTEGRTHFSMWAILAAPLIAGNDLRSMSATTKTTLTNAEVIAVDQDPLGIAGAAGRDAGHEPAGLVEDAVGDEHARGGAVQPRLVGRVDHRAVERARHPDGSRDGARSLEPHRSRIVHRLVHGVVGAEPRRRDAQGGQLALMRRIRQSRGRYWMFIDFTSQALSVQ